MNGRLSARIPKLDLRPPNNDDERSGEELVVMFTT
jgi:hypothetical protein